MNKIFLWILVVLIALGGIYWLLRSKDIHNNLNKQANSFSSNWHEYVEPHGNFKALLPTIPHVAKEQIIDPKINDLVTYQIYVSPDEDGSLFTISMIELPQKTGKKYDDKFLEDYLKEMFIKNPNNSLENFQMKNTPVGKALEFSVKNQQAIVTGNAFLKDNVIYVLSITTKPNNTLKEKFDIFVNSFKLKPASPESNKQSK